MVEIDKKDRRILAAIESSARLPISAIAKRAGVSRHVADYRLKRMEEEGIVRGHYCVLDPSRLGLMVWELWVSFHPDEDLRSFFSSIADNPLVWWFVECAGSYDAAICVLCRTPHEFHAFFKDLQQQHDNIIASAATILNVGFHFYTRGYLLDTSSTSAGKSDDSGRSLELSRTDWRIINELSVQARKPYAQIAASLSLDVKTVKRAVTLLRDEGAIVYFRTSIDASKIGYEYYKILLYLNNPQGDVSPSVLEWCKTHPDVISLISCVGAWQLELDIETRTYKDLCNILSELEERFDHGVRKQEILLVTSEGVVLREPPTRPSNL